MECYPIKSYTIAEGIMTTLVLSIIMVGILNSLVNQLR
jgi:hypothetical protein